MATKMFRASNGDPKYRANFVCKDCGLDTHEECEYYMIQHELWDSLLEKEEIIRTIPWYDREGSLIRMVHLNNVMLCVGCVEERLGRQLMPEDFTSCPVNDDKRNLRSRRLCNRMGIPFISDVSEGVV